MLTFLKRYITSDETSTTAQPVEAIYYDAHYETCLCCLGSQSPERHQPTRVYSDEQPDSAAATTQTEHQDVLN